MRTQEHVVIYARVSSAKQKSEGNLERQTQRLKHYAQVHGYEVSRMFQEQASGISETRQPLHHLLRLAEQHTIQRVLIEFPDRLARFGYLLFSTQRRQEPGLYLDGFKRNPPFWLYRGGFQVRTISNAARQSINDFELSRMGKSHLA
ncbi:recombinase family protein [Sulfobacillus thermosulfidooxidans]|uniref:recombinase family protein n=1 Tax=Sulfobacillus thermosulfidooxidans TaxID=28034 RepID=UPI000C1F9FF2|nr:recombinase family protein [Sulfobacillus thermosulfidooxidans]